MKKEYKVLLAILIIAFIIRTIFVFLFPVRWWDETVYANLGYDLSKNPFDYSFNHGWSDFVPDGMWPKAGFRAPLLPYTLSVFYFFKLDFLIDFLIPILGTFSVLFVFILGKKLFNEKVGLCSALFFAVFPLHVYYSGRILTDVFSTFFVLLTFVSFWKGYEENNNKFKILFGFFLALTLLARYTALWLIPVFLIYFLIRDKGLRFLKDKYLWLSVLSFFITLSPWFFYSFCEYGSIFGVFMHGAKAASYWGGVQSWTFFFKYWWQTFSVLGIVFVLAFVYILYKREPAKKEIYLLLVWTFFFLGMAMLMPHKEGRFLLPIIPAICIICGFFIDRIKYSKRLILALIVILLILSLFVNFYYDSRKSYTESNFCFLQGGNFLKNIKSDLVITDESPLTYYYTKKATHFYPNPWSLSALKSLIEESYLDKETYIFFTDFDMPLTEEKNIQIKKDLDNFDEVFNCLNRTIIYKYRVLRK